MYLGSCSMKKIYRTILYFINAIRNRSLQYAIKRVSPLDEKKQHPKLEKISSWLARRYRWYANKKEKNRLLRYSLEKEKREHKILTEIFKYSKRVLWYLAGTTLLGWLLDTLYWWAHPSLSQVAFISNNFNTITIADLQTGLAIYVGAVSALLGLIFALYAVGFQLSTERYSANVTDFMNEERVSNYFFSLLIFTDLFAIVTLVRLHFISQEPVASFLFTTILVAFCFLGLIIFKKHYIESMKPMRVYKRIWQMFLEMFPAITTNKGYKTKSWSIPMGARGQSKNYLTIFISLYRDLIRNEKFNDASYGPTILGCIIRDYLGNKRYINTDRGWWADQKLDQVKGDNSAEYSMKSAYEIQGRGSYFATKQDNQWFETQALELLREMRDTALGNSSDQKMLYRVSGGYREVLIGDRERIADGDPTDIYGAWQNQEFEAVDSALKDFLYFIDKVNFTDGDSPTNIINDYFAIAVTFADKWDIEPALKILETFYKGNQLNRSSSFLADRKIAAESRRVLLNYWKQLEVEQDLEGMLITPKDRLINDFRRDLEKTLDDNTKTVFATFFNHSTNMIEKLVKDSNYEYVGHFIKMQMVWMSRLLYEGRNDIAEHFADILNKNVRYLAMLPKTVQEELEMFDQAERGFFVAIYEEKPILIETYFKALVYVRWVLMQSVADPEEIARYHRMTVLWGGMIYITAELRQDHTLLEKYSLLIDMFYQNGSSKIVEIVKDYKPTNLISWEVNHYNSAYMNLARKLENELPEENYRESFGEIGYSTRYKHPSKFIQTLSEWSVDIQDRAIEGFADWVQERESNKKQLAMLGLIELLRSRGKDND